MGTKRIDFIVEDVLLLNFGAPRLQIKRLVHGDDLHVRGEETPLNG